MAGVTKDMVQDIPAIAERLVQVYQRATKEEVALGMVWYADAKAFCETLVAGTEYSLPQVIGMVSAISPRLGWGPNKSRAERLLKQHQNQQGYEGLGLGLNFGLGYAILSGEHGDTFESVDKAFTGTPRNKSTDYDKTKRQAFFRNISGEREADVTIDAWATKAALGIEYDAPGNWYQELESAYIVAAEVIGIPPREFQAIVWTRIRAEILTKTQLAAMERF